MDLRKPAGGVVQFKKFLISKGVGSLGPVPEYIAEVICGVARKEYEEKIAKQHVAVLTKIILKLRTVDETTGIHIEDKLQFSSLVQQIIDFFLAHFTQQPLLQVDLAPLNSAVADLRKLMGSWLGVHLRQTTVDEGCAALDLLGPAVMERLFNSPECEEERTTLTRIMPFASDQVIKHGFVRKRGKYSQNTPVRYAILLFRSTNNTYGGGGKDKDSIEDPFPSSPRASSTSVVMSPRSWKSRIVGRFRSKTREREKERESGDHINATVRSSTEDDGMWRGSEGMKSSDMRESENNELIVVSPPTDSPRESSNSIAPAGGAGVGSRPILMYLSESHVKAVDLSGYRIVCDNIASSTGLRYQFTLCPSQGTDTVVLEAFSKEIREEWVTVLTECGLFTTLLSTEEMREHQTKMTRVAHSLDQIVEKTAQSAKRFGAHQAHIGTKRNAQISQKIETDQAAGKLLRTCAVFGSPLSGAMAIMRAVLKHHGSDDYKQETAHIPAIRKAMWDNLRTIAEKCATLPAEVVTFSKMQSSPDADLPMAAKLLKLVWSCAEVQEVFGARKKDLMPNLAYFLDKVDTLYDEGYELSEEDLNKCSLAHVGTSVEKYSFTLRDGEFQFVHPQTTLSSKMLLTFDRIGFLVWVVSLADWELIDARTGLPHFKQDQRDFRRVIALEPFAKVPVVCFLNWSRSFLTRLHARHAIDKFKMLYPNTEYKDADSAQDLLDRTVQQYRSFIDDQRQALNANWVTAVSGVESAVEKLLTYAMDLTTTQVLETTGFGFK